MWNWEQHTVPAYKKAFSPPSVHHFEELLVRAAPSSVLLSQCLISNLGEQKPKSPPRCRETGSDSHAPSSELQVSITLNSRHIALHRPGTGGGAHSGHVYALSPRHLCPLKDVAGIWPTWCSEERVEITHLPCFQRLNWNQFVLFYKKGLQPISKACLSSATNVGKVSHWVSLFLKPRRFAVNILWKHDIRWNLRIIQNEKIHASVLS